MSLLQIILVLLSNDGHWIGGQESTISIQWNLTAEQPTAVLIWELTAAEIRIAEGRLALPATENPSTIRLTPPAVRVRTSMRWMYRLIERDSRREITRGERTLHVYPSDILSDVGRPLDGKQVVVWDSSDDLSGILAQTLVKARTIKQASDLPLERVDMILVAPDQIGEGPFEQAALAGQAEAGAEVMVFQQKRPAALVGYPLVRRAVFPRLDWRTDHPLLRRLAPDDIQSWSAGADRDLWAIQLPADEPALEVVFWPRESPGEQPVPIDAMLVVKAVGQGRIVLCQFPLGPWRTDPRSQIFLANTLDYLATRPEPTPPPSRRRTGQPVQPEAVPTVTIPRGDTQ